MISALTDSDTSPVTDGAALWSVSGGSNLVSEFEFCKQAAMRGWQVTHRGGGEPDFDVYIKRPQQRLLTVQVKGSATPATGRVHYQVQCRRSAKNGKKQLYGANAFDVLAFHMMDVDRWVFYTRAQLGTRTLTTYALPELRKNKTLNSLNAPAPNNWELLDDVAQSLTNSGGIPANVPPHLYK